MAFSYTDDPKSMTALGALDDDEGEELDDEEDEELDESEDLDEEDDK